MKILVLNYEYPPVGGGGGRACAELCAELVSRGHEVQVLTSHAEGLASNEEINGCKIWRVPTGRVDYSIATFSSMARYILSGFFPGLKLIRNWIPDVIHVHFAVPTGVLGRVLSSLTRIPYVLTAHLGDVPGGVPTKTDRWFRYLSPFTPPIWKGAAAVVAVSTYTKNLAQERYQVSIEVIPNGVKLTSSPVKPEEPEIQHQPTVVFAGRFQPQKNLPLLIDTLARIQDLDWTCKLIGDGPQRSLVEGLVVKKQLDDRVELTGWVSSDEVWDMLGESDVLAMPSLAEGLPVVGIHALAQGVAIVANRAGGLVDLVEDGVNGRLCSIGDRECFEIALRWCLEDKKRLEELKKASRQMAGRFNIERLAERYEQIFAEASRQ